jgi:glycosyltransferase-like protein
VTRIAMLTYSVKPRGGVVHALQVSEALARRGHEPRLFALSREGEGFFRAPAVPASLIASPRRPGLAFDDGILAMIDDYAAGLRGLLPGGGYEVVHAQDCLSANAALRLRDEELIGSVIRTVHHVDDFRSPSLIACQDRSIVDPDALLCVSEPWVRALREDYGVTAERVSNGVDAERYAPVAAGRGRAAARVRLGAGDRFVILTIGGIEPRKGSIALLEAFARLRAREAAQLDPLLVIAGGATLFDYRDEIARFDERRAQLGLGDDHVLTLGPQSDRDLDGLLAAADAFAFPSRKEGFGLVALEALACGLPLVCSDLPVFRTFLADGESALMTPAGDVESLAAALERVATDPRLRERLRRGGEAVVAAHGWDRSAAAHERAYARVRVGQAA